MQARKKVIKGAANRILEDPRSSQTVFDLAIEDNAIAVNLFSFSPGSILGNDSEARKAMLGDEQGRLIDFGCQSGGTVIREAQNDGIRTAVK